MDTSKTYIKMCDCPEIQEQAPEDNMDLFHEWYACGICGRVYHEDDGYYFVSCDHGKCVWLPRQDELQAMVGQHQWRLNGNFYEWLFDSTQDGWHISHEHQNFTSMEQLWLAFVMNEKYNKVWTGEDWILDRVLVEQMKEAGESE